MASKNIKEEDILFLEDIINKSDDIKSIEELIQLNTLFHNKILKIADNQRLEKLLNNLMDVILYDRDISNRYTTRRKEILEEHRNILKFLKEKDSEKFHF